MHSRILTRPTSIELNEALSLFYCFIACFADRGSLFCSRLCGGSSSRPPGKLGTCWTRYGGGTDGPTARPSKRSCITDLKELRICDGYVKIVNDSTENTQTYNPQGERSGSEVSIFGICCKLVSKPFFAFCLC